MKKTLFILILMFSFFSKAHANYSTLANSFSFKNVDGGEIKLQDYKDKVIIVVNVASKCGFTNQYEDLQTIWSKYKSEGLVVIGVPSNTFGIDFPIAEKTEVVGKDAHPFFLWAKENHGSGAVPKWNFHKIVIGKDGKVVDTFASITKPTSNRFIELIEKELKK
jgi:glutathione peroxidase